MSFVFHFTSSVDQYRHLRVKLALEYFRFLTTSRATIAWYRYNSGACQSAEFIWSTIDHQDCPSLAIPRRQSPDLLFPTGTTLWRSSTPNWDNFNFVGVTAFQKTGRGTRGTLTPWYTPALCVPTGLFATFVWVLAHDTCSPRNLGAHSMERAPLAT